MSVYIKGMEMPTSCEDCDFAYQDQDSEHNVYWTCAAVHKSACMHERREDCPLVPVPPHGDLIDQDAYRDEFMNGVYALCSDDSDNYRANKIIDLFDEAPTIIPAEEET